MDCHIVPRFHLAQFADPDTGSGRRQRVWKYRFDVGKWRSVSPRSVASELDYYVAVNDAGERDESIERELIGPMEDAMAKLLQYRLSPGMPVADADRLTVARYVALMSLRTRYQHEVIAETVGEISETALLMACAIAESDPTSASIRELLKTHRVRVGHRMPMAISLSLVDDIAHEILRMGWTLVVAASGDYFVASDDPYRQIVPEAVPQSAHGGLGHPNVEVSLPLSRRLAFFAGWHSHGVRWAPAPHDFVTDINRRTCMSASIIVAPKPSVVGLDQILRDWEGRKLRFQELGLV